MIRFIIGILTVIAGVGAIEGTAPLAVGIIISTLGMLIMLWSIESMMKSGDIA
jgi:uncharacterized MnhB-related membrane protein